jgi:HK97 family phage major capsid protein
MSDTEQLKKLQEKTAGLFEELKTRNDEKILEAETRGGEATAEVTAAVEKVNADITEIREITVELEKRLNRPKIDTNGKEINELSPEQESRQNAFVKFIRNGADGMEVEEKRALAGTADNDGGIFIPPTFEKGIIMNAYDQAEIRPLCQVGKTSRDTVIFGSLSKPVVTWGRKAIPITAQDLDSGGKRMEVFWTTGLTSISIDTLDDAEANIVSEMTNGFGNAIAEAEDDAFAVGAGDNSPSGIASDATVQANYSASGISDALYDASNNGIDCMIDAQYKIKKTYRRNASWGMNSSTEGAVRKLKDGDGRYYWQPSLQIGTPPKFDGYRIINPEGLADIAANAIVMIFGDYKQYKIRDRKGMTVQRLVEKYAEYGEIGFLIRKRVGGMLILPEAFSCVKIVAS